MGRGGQCDGQISWSPSQQPEQTSQLQQHVIEVKNEHCNSGLCVVYWLLHLVLLNCLLRCVNKMTKKWKTVFYLLSPCSESVSHYNLLSCEVKHWPTLEPSLPLTSPKLSPRVLWIQTIITPLFISAQLYWCKNIATLIRAIRSIKQRRKEPHSHLPRPSPANLAAEFCCLNSIFSLDKKPLLELAGGET